MACPPRDAFQIGWICALPIEAAAAKEMLDENFGTLDAQDPADTNAYTLGRIGKHYVVIACLPGGQYGTTSATTVANHMVRTFSKSLRIGLMVGVAGAIPSDSHDIRLGDVVISCPEGTSGGVIQYDMGKIGTKGEFHRTGSLNSPPRSLLTALNLMRAAELTDDPLYPGYILKSTERNERTRQTFGQPGAKQDRLFKPEYDHPEHALECDTCLAEWEEARTERGGIAPKPHYGIIASGNTVIKDAETREKLRLRTGALCFEMEAAGLMMDFPCIVIRGISLAAASYAKELLGYVPTGLVLQEQLVVNMYKYREEELKQEVEGIHLRLTQAQDQREQHHYEKMTRNLKDQQRKCHQVFKVVNYSEQKDINPIPAEGTCEWALNSSEYLRWTASDRNELLWVSADPGCGKSVLARSIIDSYVRESTPAVTICYFFFKDNESQNNLAAALCSLLHQLFSQRPDLLYQALPSWEMNGQALQNEPNELWRIFIAATSSDAPVHTICILDALDECCDIDQDRLTQNLKSFYHACQPTQDFQSSFLKFLVTSRPYNQIRNHFQSLENFSYLHLKGEEENDQIHHEIDLVVKARTKELAKAALLSRESQQGLQQQLLRMEHRTYLWLHLAFDDIRSTFENSLWPAEESIRMIPSSVDKAYEKILSRVPSGQLSTVKKIFQIIIAAREPLTTSQLAMALGISIRPGSQSAAEAMIDPVENLCGLFVFVNNSKVYLIHQTAREYLMKGLAASHPLSCSLQGAEEQMAHVCLQYLSVQEFDSTDPNKYIGVADLLDYAALYWANHVRLMSSAAELEVKDLLDRVYDTTTNRFLLWFSKFWRIVWGRNEPLPKLTPMHIAALNGHRNVVARLLGEGQVNPNVADSTGSYPLTYASFMGHDETVAIIIEHGGDVDAQGGRYGGPLLAACYGGRENTVRILLSYGADFNAEYENQHSALHIASRSGYGKIVQMLLEYGADPNAKNFLCDTNLLGRAFVLADTSMMHMLLMHGADPNFSFGSNRVLHIACHQGHEEIVQMLLDFGADVNAKDRNSNSALATACRLGSKNVVQILLDSGSDVNAKDKNGSSVLHEACIAGSETIVQMLLNSGSDVNARDETDTSVLQTAFLGENHSILHLLCKHVPDVNRIYGVRRVLGWACLKNREKTVQMLFDYGLKLSRQAYQEALNDACLGGHDNTVRALLEYGNPKPKNYNKVLKFACVAGHEKIVQDLLEHRNIKPEVCTKFLRAACSGGHDNFVQIFLTHGVTVNGKIGYCGHFELTLARREGHQKIVQMLLEHGAGTCGTCQSRTIQFSLLHALLIFVPFGAFWLIFF
ncbi:hypothetical protein N7541_000597 [Penicillium brevicompactum]|uniref:NACHT domain-containing protein n=1 Tax=Penicillium brevicompactum TaxID=5074 RepID=A0A9W9V569_PENBR|nr:hypothetical protein N7541_000597 [Penicillium brevicompactum]